MSWNYDACSFNGMTLRDYFAAKVLQSQLLDKSSENWPNLDRAENAYAMADAMLKTRGKEIES